MSHMYKEIPDKALETFSFGSVHFLLSGLPTINWILRHTLLPISGDHNMIIGHAINMLHIFDVPQKFKVMCLMVETIKRTAADQKRSCGYAPQIQELINSKMGTGNINWIKNIFLSIQTLRTIKLSWMKMNHHKCKLKRRRRKQGKRRLPRCQLKRRHLSISWRTSRSSLVTW